AALRPRVRPPRPPPTDARPVVATRRRARRGGGRPAPLPTSPPPAVDQPDRARRGRDPSHLAHDGLVRLPLLPPPLPVAGRAGGRSPGLPAHALLPRTPRLGEPPRAPDPRRSRVACPPPLAGPPLP